MSVDPTGQDLKRLLEEHPEGEIVMLNLLRFKPDGRASYERYARETGRFLEKVGATLLYAGVGALVGDTAARHVGVLKLLFTATLYDVLLAPFTVPWIMALARRIDKDTVTGDTAGGSVSGPYRWITPGTVRGGSRNRLGAGRGSLLKGGRKL